MHEKRDKMSNVRIDSARETLLEIGMELAEYLANCDDKEREDYEKHKLNPADFLGNSRLKGPHIYAVAKRYIYLVEMIDQWETEHVTGHYKPIIDPPDRGDDE